jgi:copper(I)-binding protein
MITAMITLRFLLLSPAALLALAATAFASDIMVMDAKAPASLTPSAKTAAIYMVLMNHGMETDVLKGVSTPAADHASAHQTIDDNGVMKMREIEKLELNPHDTVTFAPGGNHIMLMGLKAPLKAGDTLPLVMTFAKAGEVKIDVQVVDRVDGSAAEHDHSE